jgi:hypothetical protein
MGNTYITFNGASPTTAALTSITTGTAIKTLLQIATPSTKSLKVIEWGIDFDGSPAAIKVELVQTDVAATVTAAVAAGVQPYGDPNSPASAMTLGTTATGYTATIEGSTTVTRYADVRILSTNTYVKQWPLGREFQLPVSKFLRVRVTASVAVNATCYVIWDE